MAGHDVTLEVSDELLQDAIRNHGFVCTADIEQIRDCNFYVVAVPTPVDKITIQISLLSMKLALPLERLFLKVTL